MSCCGKNQTTTKSAGLLAKDETIVIGTGVFLVPAPEKGVLEYRTVVVENLSPEETIKRGYNCTAFRWVHPNEMSFSQLSVARDCYGFCPTGRECSDPRCFCDGTSNWCR